MTAAEMFSAAGFPHDRLLFRTDLFPVWTSGMKTAAGRRGKGARYISGKDPFCTPFFRIEDRYGCKKGSCIGVTGIPA